LETPEGKSNVNFTPHYNLWAAWHLTHSGHSKNSYRMKG
jgi:hypothetical protein